MSMINLIIDLGKAVDLTISRAIFIEIDDSINFFELSL